MRALLTTALAGLLSLATAGAAAADTTCSSADLVGTWSADVILSDSQPDHAVISFTKSGKVCLTTSISAGNGSWWREDGTGFGWSDKEIFQAQPGFPGYVQILQHGTQDGDTFTSSGQSRVYDQQGNFLKTVTADVNATRTSPSPDPACA